MRFGIAELLLICFLFTAQYARAQSDTLPGTASGYVDVGTLGSTSSAVPFWQRVNQYGTVPLAGSLATIRAGFFKEYQPGRSSRFDWGYGLEAVGNTAPTGQQFLVPQAYVKAHWRQLELYAGRRKTIVGLVDTLLTSGAYILSGNALPLPTVQLGTRGFVALPFTRGVLSIYATYGHAWFETNNRKVEHALLHQASFYTRIGKPTWAVHLVAGLNHQVAWGGYSPYLSNNVSNNGQLPSSFKAYLYAVTALAYPGSVDANTTFFDETNRIGNHLGSLDLGVEVSLGSSTLLLYRQNPYETGAIWYLTTIADGLNGLSIRRHNRGDGWLSVDRGLVEFLYTVNQGGNQFVADQPYMRGRVNYFNNSQYIDGWTTHNRTIGTPFLTSVGELRPDNPAGPIVNNRVAVWHFGLSGHVAQRLNWLVKLSAGRNLGTYDTPFRTQLSQLSALLQVTAPVRLPLLGNLQLTSSLATDEGGLLPRSTGAFLSLRKNWPATRRLVSARRLVQ